MLWWGAECPPEQWKCYVCASTKVIGAEIRVRPERQHSLINWPMTKLKAPKSKGRGDIIWKQKDNKDMDIWRTALKINPRDLCTSRHFYISDTWEQQSLQSLSPFNTERHGTSLAILVMFYVLNLQAFFARESEINCRALKCRWTCAARCWRMPQQLCM